MPIQSTDFASFEDLSNNPESNATRSGTIEQLTTFTNTFNEIANSLDSQRIAIGFGMDQVVGEINRITEQLGELNQDIRRSTAGGNNPNDLLDTRDNLRSCLVMRRWKFVINRSIGGS